MRNPKPESGNAQSQAAELGPVLATLDRVRREWHTARILSGLFFFLAASLAAAWIIMLITLWFPLPATVRWSLRTGWVLAAVISAIPLVFKRLLENPTDEDVALLIERAQPTLNNELINAVRLVEDPGKQKRIFVRAAIRESSRVATEINTKKAVSWRPFRRRLFFLLAMLALWAGLIFIFPARCTNAFSRLLHPNANLARIGRIQIVEVTPGDTTVIAGENLEVRARIEVPSGNTSSIVVRHTVGKGPVHEEKMTLADDGTYTCVLLDVKAERRYRVAAGDSISRWYNVAVTERPIVGKIAAIYRFPQYTGMEPATVDDCGGVLRAVKGTLAELRITANKRLSSAMYVGHDGEKPISFYLDPGRDSGRMQEDLTIEENTEGQIEIADEFDCRNSRPVRIIAVEDTPPRVQITSPGSDRVLSAGETLELAIRGTDDFGIANVELIERRLDPATGVLGEATVIQSWSAFNDPRNIAVHWSWSFAKTSYHNGEIIRYYVKMTDGNNVTGPGIGTSSEFVVRLEDVAAKREELEKKYNTWQAELEKILKEQKALRTSISPDNEPPENEGGKTE